MINNLLQHFRNNLNNDLLYIAIISGSVAAIIIVFGKMISLVLRKILKPIVKRSKTQIDDQMFELMKSTFFKIIILIGLSVGLGIFKSGLSLKSGSPPQKLISYYPYFEDDSRIAYTDGEFSIRVVKSICPTADRKKILQPIYDSLGEVKVYCR